MTISAFPHDVEASVAAGPATEKPAPADLRNLASAVRLIDRRTGQTHRINGRPLVPFTRTPAQAAADLLKGRDVAV